MYKLFSAIFYLFVYDSHLAGQFQEICNFSLYLRDEYQQDRVD